MRSPPPPLGDNWKPWGERLTSYLTRIKDVLSTRLTSDNPSEDGILLWDRAGYPVVSIDNDWVPLSLASGPTRSMAHLEITSNVTAASSNTAYSLDYTLMSGSTGVTIGTPTSRMVIANAGRYQFDVSFQITSSSGSTVDFWMWPRINGADVTDTGMRNSLHDNHATLLLSRTYVFDIDDDDYFEMMWATSGTQGSLDARGAESFAPACPASTLAITRLN